MRPYIPTTEQLAIDRWTSGIRQGHRTNFSRRKWWLTQLSTKIRKSDELSHNPSRYACASTHRVPTATRVARKTKWTSMDASIMSRRTWRSRHSRCRVFNTLAFHTERWIRFPA